MRKYILPTTDWAPLLGPIVKDARPGDVLEVHTQEMWELATEIVRKEGRTISSCGCSKLRRHAYLAMLKEYGVDVCR